MMLWIDRSLVLVAIALVMAVAGCGGGGGSGGGGTTDKSGAVPSGKAPQSVTIELRSDVDTFDAHTSVNESGAQQVFSGIYDTLIKLASGGPKAGGVLPGLATSWKSTPSSATFTLHDNLTCSNSTPLTPSGIAKSMRRLGNPKTGALFASRIFGPGGLDSVTADDASNTVTVTVKRPYTYLVEGMADAYVICPDGLDDPDALAQRPAGTGPYRLVSSKRGQSYELARRDDYNALPPGMTLDQYPQSLEMRVVKDDTTRANLLQTREADIGSVLGQDAQRLRSSGALEEVEGAGFGVSALLFNQAKGQLGTDPRVRRALSFAVDAADYTKAASFNVSEPIATVYSPNMDCYDKANSALTPGFDLDQSRALLKQAGWTLGGDGKFTKNGKTLAVRLLGYDVQNNGPEYIADALRELGVDVKVTDTSFQGAIEVLFGTGEWDVFVFPYTSEIYVPSLMVSQISGDPATSLNVGSVSNAEYDSLSGKASGATGPERCQLWGEAAAALLEQVDIKPLMWDKADWFGNGVTFEAQFWVTDLRTIRTTD